MRKVVYGLVIALAILHHDFWFWHDDTLVLGFIPIGLAYHAVYSLLAGLVWALAVKYAWPTTIDEEFAALENEQSGGSAKP